MAESMDMLILEEQLLQLQIKKTKLLEQQKGKSSSESQSSEKSYKDQVLKPKTNMVKLGSIPRAQGNSNFPESPIIKQLATTELTQDIGQSSRQQTARRKDKSNPLMDSSYPKGEMGHKPKTAPKGLKPKPAVTKEQSSTVQTVKPKRWMPNNKRPVNPEQHKILSQLMTNSVDTATIRIIEKAFYQNNKIEAKPIKFNTSIKPIIVHPEVEIPQDQLSSYIPLSEVESIVFPGFYYQKSRWNKIYKALNESNSSSVFLYKAFGEEATQWESAIEIMEAYGFRMINVLSNKIPPEIFSELFMNGFINGVKIFWNYEEMFKGSPPEVLSFLSFCLHTDGLTEELIRLKTAYIKVLTAPPLLEEFWKPEFGRIPVEELVFLAPKKYPSVHVLIEDEDLKPINFDARSMDEDCLSPMAKRRAVGLQQIEAFIYTTKLRLDFQMHFDLERIICYRLKPRRFAGVKLEHLFEEEDHFLNKQAHFQKKEGPVQDVQNQMDNPFDDKKAPLKFVSSDSVSTPAETIRQAANNRQAIFGDSPLLIIEEHVKNLATSKVSTKDKM